MSSVCVFTHYYILYREVKEGKRKEESGRRKEDKRGKRIRKEKNNAKSCIFLWRYAGNCIILQPDSHKYSNMKVKNNRLEALRMIISSQELGSQDELLSALKGEGFQLTQATLSRDLKQLKVAKAATMRGNYVYVLPNDTMYKRVSTPHSVREMLQVPGFLSITFSGNMGVIKTRPGYASSIAYNIDNNHIDGILGTIAGDDTIFIVIKQGVMKEEIIDALSEVVPNLR